jgi:sulfite exporter TauE/SafE
MSQQPVNLFRRSRRWLLPAALFVLAPKCVLCLLAYAGIGAALGLSGPEICGASSSSTMSLWTTVFVLGGAALSVIGLYARHRAATKTHQHRQNRLGPS